MEFACKKINVEDVISCSLGLKKKEYVLFEKLLQEQDPVTIHDFAEKIHLDRTTVQKVMKKFVDQQLVTRYQENLETGGYVFLYKVAEKSVIKKRVHLMIKQWADAASGNVEKW